VRKVDLIAICLVQNLIGFEEGQRTSDRKVVSVQPRLGQSRTGKFVHHNCAEGKNFLPIFLVHWHCYSLQRQAPFFARISCHLPPYTLQNERRREK
jgi:hypothetical protein